MLHKYCKKIALFQHYFILKFLWRLLIIHIENQHETHPKCRYKMQSLALATGNVYPSISKIGQYNPAIAFEGYISTYSNCDFQILHAKIYQYVNVQLTTSCESEDILILVLLRTLLSVMLGENGFWSAIFSVQYLGPYLSE